MSSRPLWALGRVAISGPILKLNFGYSIASTTSVFRCLHCLRQMSISTCPETGVSAVLSGTYSVRTSFAVSTSPLCFQGFARHAVIP